MLLALSQKYDKNAGFGTLMANMLPYNNCIFLLYDNTAADLVHTGNPVWTWGAA